jgi:hypothetical protein
MMSSWGGVYGQIHMGSKVGGSPALAFRRKHDGRFQITTRGQFDDEGTLQYEGPLAFGKTHDIVYRLVLHPTDGSLQVWINGKKLVDVAKASIGHAAGDSYWNIGLYFPKNVIPKAVAEYANHAYPSTKSLESRILNPPGWPSN